MTFRALTKGNIFLRTSIGPITGLLAQSNRVPPSTAPMIETNMERCYKKGISLSIHYALKLQMSPISTHKAMLLWWRSSLSWWISQVDYQRSLYRRQHFSHSFSGFQYDEINTLLQASAPCGTLMGCRLVPPDVSPTFALSQAFPPRPTAWAIAAKSPRQGPTGGTTWGRRG